MVLEMAKILVVDFGSRFVHKEVAKRLQERGIAYDLVVWQLVKRELEENKYDGIILSGSPSSVYDENAPTIGKDCLEGKIPVLGICYGMQLISYLYGAKVARAERKEEGTTDITFKKSALFEGIKSSNVVEMRHGDRVYDLPEGFICTASTQDCPIAAIENRAKGIYAVQFHPELGGCGNQVFDNFFYKICKLV